VCGTLPDMDHSAYCMIDDSSEGGRQRGNGRGRSLSQLSFVKLVKARRGLAVRSVSGSTVEDNVRQPLEDCETPPAELTYESSSVKVQCEEGFTLGGVAGGAAYAVISCQADRSFSEVGERCEAPRFQVKGEVTDSQSESVKLSGAELVFKDQAGRQLGTTTTDGRGRYEATLPGGHIKAEATKDGYISAQVIMKVESDISPGQGGDLSLSKILPAGEWRVVLTWDKYPRDVDSRTYFGKLTRGYYGARFAREVYFGRQRLRDSTSGIEAELDRDDTTSYGPETTTLKGIGKCKAGNDCSVVFKTHNWSKEKPLGASGGVIKVYEGNRMVAEYMIPEDWTEEYYTVFTLDATEGQVKIREGYHEPPPQLGQAGSFSTYWSQDWPSYGSTSKFIYGLEANQKFGNLAQIRVGYTYTVEDNIECQATRWDLSEENTWALCPAGYFVNQMSKPYGYAHRDEDNEINDIESARCCRAQQMPESWGTCIDVEANMWKDDKKVTCKPLASGELTAMVGLHRGTEPKDSYKSIDTLKCCAFAAETAAER